MENIALNTVVPLLLLIGIGYLSRRTGILKSGDERVLSAYVYFFALPSLLFANMSEVSFSHDTIRFAIMCMLPLLAVLIIHILLYKIFKFAKDILYLLIIVSVFGSVAFYGIPFVLFAFPGVEGERLSILATSSTALLSVPISITVLELYKFKDLTLQKAFSHVLGRIVKNPLILAIFLGTIFSLTGIYIPATISSVLHMLGKTTGTVAIFMLGVFLFGRKYGNFKIAATLSILRIAVMPFIAFIVVGLVGLPGLGRSIAVIMNGVPLAVSVLILSERYDFFKETIATIILISSVGAAISLNIWLMVLGH